MNFPDYTNEELYWVNNQLVAGVDEAGRGPLAGPVVAAAVILEPTTIIQGINDSKKLTEKKRRKIYDQIFKNALDVSIGIVSHTRIDEINILQASVEAMKLALNGLRIVPHHILVDGNYFAEYDIPYTTIVKGDAQSVSIAAASIIAKVTRDDLMVELSNKYPAYGFDKHKGYPTDFHFQAIEKYGICEVHRMSFVKNIVNKQESLF